MKLNPFPCHEYFPHHQEDAGGYRSCLHPRCQCNSVSTRRELMSDQYLKRSAGHNNGQRHQYGRAEVHAHIQSAK